MFRRILFPTDFSEISKKALPYLKQLKAAGAAEVIVLHVTSQRDIDALVGDVGLSQRLLEQAERAAREEMGKIEAKLKHEGLAVRTVIKKGNAFKEIIDLAAKEKVSLIILGSHGRSNFSEVLLGSTSENVIRHSKVPLLVINRETVVKL